MSTLTYINRKKASTSLSYRNRRHNADSNNCLQTDDVENSCKKRINSGEKTMLNLNAVSSTKALT